CCYIARRFGVHSAMPMFQALKACPDAIVIRPDMAKYRRIGRDIRELMTRITPQVEPISVDEAFLDMSGTERLHGGSAARTLVEFARGVEQQIGITVSIGLSYNKYLAKIGSGLNKPKGFTIIGRAEAVGFLADKPVALLWGVGPVMQKRLASDGIRLIGQLHEFSEEDLAHRYGSLGHRLARFARGEDSRRVEKGGGRKSLSAETTFAENISDLADLNHRLWKLSEKVSAALKAEAIGGRTITLKLKTANFKLRNRSVTLPDSTVLADRIYRAAAALLAREADGASFRLIGVGVSGLTSADMADPPDLVDMASEQRKDVERVMDQLRDKFGRDAIAKGR
ncbi:MAG: DNA polymerase IV, partial [Rhodospirillales bacterium]|nr:DNA polymerase IV [Rhodospirillales bacterium]